MFLCVLLQVFSSAVGPLLTLQNLPIQFFLASVLGLAEAVLCTGLDWTDVDLLQTRTMDEQTANVSTQAAIPGTTENVSDMSPTDGRPEANDFLLYKIGEYLCESKP